MPYELEKLSLLELKKLGQRLELPANLTKQELISRIGAEFGHYEEYKKDKLERYTRHEQLGKKGKEGITYLVSDKNGKEYAMKTFRKGKSSKTLKKEFDLQKKAGKIGVAPKVYDYDIVGKWIVMEKMDRHLITDLTKINLTKADQLRILEIFRLLDEIKVLQGDVNVINLMVRKNQIYLIDYGFAKEITPELCRKMKTNHPNTELMTVGFVIKLKELGAPEKSYHYLLHSLNKDLRKMYGL